MINTKRTNTVDGIDKVLIYNQNAPDTDELLDNFYLFFK